MDKAVKQLKARQVPRQEWPEELQVFVNAAEKKMKETKKNPTETSTTVTSNAGEIDDDADGISAFDIASQVVTDEIQDLDISLRT